MAVRAEQAAMAAPAPEDMDMQAQYLARALPHTIMVKLP